MSQRQLTFEERQGLHALLSAASRERVRRTALAELEIAAVIRRPIEAEDRAASGEDRKRPHKPQAQLTPEQQEKRRKQWRARKLRARAIAMHNERMRGGE